MFHTAERKFSHSVDKTSREQSICYLEGRKVKVLMCGACGVDGAMHTCNGCVLVAVCWRVHTSVDVTLTRERNIVQREGCIGKNQTQLQSIGLIKPDRLPLSLIFSDEGSTF